jgi:hypothetical protein
MAYWDVYSLSADADFISRVTACYAVETVQTDPDANPPEWADQHRWDMAALPGFGDAYASAVASGVPDPGRDPAVISDAMLLSGVQGVMNQGA